MVAVADRGDEPGSLRLGDDLPDKQGEQDQNEAGSQRLERPPDWATIRVRRNSCALLACGLLGFRRGQDRFRIS